MRFLAQRRERQRDARVYLRSLEGMRDEAINLCIDIERTAASFGTDRLFDERLRKIEDRAVRIRKRAEHARPA